MGVFFFVCVSSAYLVLGLERSHGRPVARFFLIMTTASIFHRVRARWFVSYLRGSKVDHLAHYYQEIAVCVEHAEIQCMALCSHFGSQCSQCLQTTRLRAIRAKSWTVRACRRRVDYNAVRERLKRGARSCTCVLLNSKFFQQLSSESLRNRAKHDRIDGTATTDAIAAPEVQTRLTNKLT